VGSRSRLTWIVGGLFVLLAVLFGDVVTENAACWFGSAPSC
jgi:hypothetical protein